MKNNAWKLKDVLLIAICAVLFGVVYLGCTYVGGILYGILTPFGMASLGYEPFYGIYFMAGAFGVYVMRKPGAGLIAELLAAVLECLFGNYFGPIIILSGLVQGFGFELIVALKGYKKFDRLTMIEGAVLWAEKRGAEAVGVNCCSIAAATQALPRMVAAARTPVMVRPNAGMPVRDEDDTLTWPDGPEAFGRAVNDWVAAGAHLVGACCGATPQTTAAMADALA